MTVYSEDFTETLDDDTWVQSNVAEPIFALGGLLRTSTQSDYIGTISYTVANPIITIGVLTTVDLGVPHNYGIGEQWLVRIKDNTTAPSINGSHVATANGANSFLIAIDTSLGAGVNDGLVIFNRKATDLLGGPQELQATVIASAVTSPVATWAILWARLDERLGPVTAIRAGYGCQYEWTDTETRTMRFLKIDPATGLFRILVETTDQTAMVPILGPDGTDLNVSQLVRFTVTDEELVGREPRAVRLRAWLNNDAHAGPALEWIDRGGGGPPGHYGGGAWGLTLGDPSVAIDSFEAQDTYELPDFGTGISRFRTKTEFRDMIKDELSRGAPTNLDDDRVDQAAEDGITEYLEDLGDSALFLRRLVELNLQSDDNNLLTLIPNLYEHIFEIYDVQSKLPARWHRVGENDNGQILIAFHDAPISQNYILDAKIRWHAVMEDTGYIPIPKEHDEPARVAAMWRLVDSRRDREFRESLIQRYTRLAKKKIGRFQKMKRAEKPHITVSTGESAMGGLLGGIVQRRGPF